MEGLFASLWRRRATLAAGATLGAAAVTISTLAVLYPGVPTADLELDDGGVWVTKTDDLLVGHLNYPSRLLDGAVRTAAPDFDVLQGGDRILVVDRAGGTVTAVDPATAGFTGDQTLPENGDIALAGSTVAVAGGGRLYAVDYDELLGAAFGEDESLAEVGADAEAAVSSDGERVFAASAAEKTLTTVDVSTGDVQTAALDGLAPGAELQLATVGRTPVVFDAAAGTVYVNGGAGVKVPGGADGRLQQSSAEADGAYIQTATGLYRQPLGGGEPQQVAEAQGADAAAPVQLNGCVYAVWADGEYVRDCADDGADAQVDIDLPSDATPVLRVNRRVVVVNDTRSGTVWVVSDKAERVDNWDDVLPPPADDAEEEESEDEQPQFQLPDRGADNHPPVAVDDAYGVRPGRTTILRVTEHDSDPDGDLLSASLAGEAPAGFTITPVLGGAALQVAVAANADGTASFRYVAEDGRGMDDDATVSLTVRSADQNEPPQLKKAKTIQVEAGASVTYAALDDWKDPDGDEMFLAGASVEGGDVVSYRPNGVIEFTAASGAIGIKDVTLTVSDGIETAQDVLHVDVRAKGSLNPIANADRAVATAGIPITVFPLLNDISISGEPLKMSQTDTPRGARVTPNYESDSFEFSADEAGTYYVQYFATAGPRSALGIVRIDVSPATADGAPPVATKDTALLPTGRSTLVDVLANDEDPSGGILVVQSARAASGSGVSVEVLEHSILRITDVSGLSAPVTVQYTVSNGSQSAIGDVVVVPVPLPETLRPPVAVDDEATVRVGDVVTVEVLKNDYHPDNDTISLVADFVETNIGDGVAFADGDRIRFQAGDTPGTAYITYEITDSQGQKDAGYLTIQVRAADAGTNSAPRPRPVVARVIAGNSVRIAVPLDGIDPDGDSVEIVGVSSNPALGRVTVGDTWLTYNAFEGSQGRDSFTYTVRDRLGAVAESLITVGVAPPGVDNQAPYAVQDVVHVRPGRQVSVPVTVNDSDPDGDEIAIVKNGLTAPKGVAAEVSAGRVLVTAPSTPGDVTITYTISDSFGATAQGVLLLSVDEDAPPQAPIARDDRVQRADVKGASVKVAVLDNDEDPDGTVDALDVEVFDENAKVRSGGIVEVALTPASQLIRYSITDQDGQIGQAFVFVPGADGLLPTLIGAEPVVVKSGETVRIPLSDHVLVRDGRTARIAVADSVRTGHSNGAPLVVDATTVEYTSAEGYYGPDSIGVLVTDGTGPDDPEGLAAYVSIPITVLPAENQSPVVRSAAVQVAPGEDAVEVNLAKLTRDPDEGDLKRITFSIAGDVPKGYTASISATTLTVKADADVEPGSVERLVIRADDGTSTPGEGVISLTAVSSQRPMPVANADVVADAKEGTPVTVDVLANDFNPFEGEKPLEVLAARVDTAGAHTATVEGDKVEVTPAAGFNGTLIVSYRIGDATKAADRQAEGKITLTVRGKPSRPGVPTVTSIQDRTVVLSWTPPSNNGSPITSYEVSSQNGYAKTCASTTCTLDGLTNDVEYTFQVVAVNEVGESEPSPMSAVARPDARPDTPAPPTLAFADKSLTVSWTAPHSSGSPVLSYDLEISPAPATGPLQKTGVTGSSLVWTGLQNGVAYQVKVRAVNRAPEPSEWSGYSASMVPAAPPDAPGQPQTTPASPVGSQAQIAVSWTAPANDNGDAVSGYALSVKRGGSVVQTIPVVGTSQNVTVDTSETDYTFSVTARNKAGDSVPSADSAPRRGATAPGAPTAVTLTPKDGSAVVTFSNGPLNGNRANEITYSYRVNQTGAQGTIASGGTIGGLSNGTSYTVNVWATSSVQGVSPGAEATSTAAIPFGKPVITLQGIDRQQGGVRFRWTVSENGRTITAASYGGAGSNEQTVGGLAANQRTSITVSYTNEAGTSSATWEGRAAANPQLNVSKGSAGNNAGCTSGACRYIKVTATGFEPNSSYSGVTWTDCAGYGNECTGGSSMPSSMTAGGFSFSTDDNGNATVNANLFGFPGSNVWAKVGGVESNHLNW